MNFLFPIKAKYMVMIYAGVELLMSTGVNSGVSNIAHLGGMVVGFVYLKSRLPGLRIKVPDWRSAYRQWKLQRAKRKFQVYMKKHDRGPSVESDPETAPRTGASFDIVTLEVRLCDP